jgi:two-component system response regulator NreC
MRQKDATPSKVRLLLAEDIPFWMRFTAGALTRVSWIEYLGCAKTWEEIPAYPLRKKSTILVMTDTLLANDITGRVRQLKKNYPLLKIALFTTRKDPVAIHSYDSTRLDAMISKDHVSGEELTQTLSALVQGNRRISPALETIRNSINQDPVAWWKILSDRELQIIPHLGKGISDKTIATQLHANRATIRVHRQNIMRKLNCHGKTDMMRWALTTGFITLDQLADTLPSRRKTKPYALNSLME